MTFAEILSRFDIVHEERDGYVVICPAHEDGHPSLRIALQDDGTVTLHCRAACTKSAVLDALEEHHGIRRRDLFDVTPGEGIEVRRASRTDGPLPPGAIAGLRSYILDCEEALWNDDDLAEEARTYIRERFGLTDDAARTFRLGLDHGGTRHPFEYRSNTYAAVPRLVVPFSDPEDPDLFHAAQGRALREHRVRWSSLSNPEGSSWGPTAAFYSTGRPYVLITEGPSDALTVVAGGYDAIAVAGASRTSDDVVDSLTEALSGRTVVVVGDGDPAGRLFTGALSQALADNGLTVSVLDLPGGDVNDWRSYRPDTFADDLHAEVRKARRITPSDDSPLDPPESDEDEGPDLTDLGNAERLLSGLGGPKQIRYSPEVGFVRWNGQVWEEDRHNAVTTAAFQVTKAMKAEARQMLRDAAKMPDSSAKDALMEKGKKLRGWAKGSQSERALKAMPNLLQALPGVAIDVGGMDSHAHLLTFANGIVDLRDGTLHPHDPDLLLTKRIAHDYNPDARPVRWERFLQEVFPEDPELPTYVQRLIGYGITGSTAEQCFAVLWGHGANGKSVFTETISEVFRDIVQTTPFSTFEEKQSGGIPNDLAMLRGARLVMASEGDRNRKMAEAMIKRVTGKDTVTARFMRKEFFEFHPSFLILLATNHKPQFRGQDEGLWRRVKLIPWVRYFAKEEREKDLDTYLQTEEAEGIIAWAVRGAIEWYANGLQDPTSVSLATEQYRETSDALSGYLPGRLERERGSTVLGADAYHAYIEWAEEEGLPEREKWTRRTFYGALEERGVDRKKTAKGQTLLGVRLVDPDADIEPEVGRTPDGSSIHHKGQSLDDTFE